MQQQKLLNNHWHERSGLVRLREKSVRRPSRGYPQAHLVERIDRAKKRQRRAKQPLRPRSMKSRQHLLGACVLLLSVNFSDWNQTVISPWPPSWKSKAAAKSCSWIAKVCAIVGLPWKARVLAIDFWKKFSSTRRTKRVFRTITREGSSYREQSRTSAGACGASVPPAVDRG